MNENLTLGSLFDGIGGFLLPAQKHGIKTIWASEIEPMPIAITKQKIPEIKQVHYYIPIIKVRSVFI